VGSGDEGREEGEWIRIENFARSLCTPTTHGTDAGVQVGPSFESSRKFQHLRDASSWEISVIRWALRVPTEKRPQSAVCFPLRDTLPPCNDRSGALRQSPTPPIDFTAHYILQRPGEYNAQKTVHIRRCVGEHPCRRANVHLVHTGISVESRGLQWV